MNELSGTYEYVVAKKVRGRYRMQRIGMIMLYILYVIAFSAIIGFAFHLFVLMAFIPVTLWMVIFLTWRYVSVEFEYSITSGNLTFSKIYGRRTRKQVTDFRIKSAETIAPLNNALHKSKLDAFRPEIVYSALSSPDAEDGYFMTFTNEEGQRCAFLFEATTQALKVCRYYNPTATVVTEVRR